MISEFLIKTFDGKKLWCEGRVSDESLPWIILVHGMGEHCHRHLFLWNLVKKHYNIAWYDLRSHGRSEGQNGEIQNFSDHVKDLESFIEHVGSHHDLSNFILWGHSLGGLIVSSYLKEKRKRSPLKVLLSSPAVGVPAPFKYLKGRLVHSSMEWVAGKLSKVSLPQVINPNGLSHDLRVGKDYAEDDLTLKSISISLGLETILQTQRVFRSPLEFSGHISVVYGDDDDLVDSKATGKFFRKFHQNAKLNLIPGAKHELHNEVSPYRDHYLKILSDFLEINF